MDAAYAENKTTLNDKEHAAFSEYPDTRMEGCDANFKRDRFASQQQQRSIDYEEVVASTISYSLSSVPSSSDGPLSHGDVVQIISSWSAVNDGVIQVHGDQVSAVGIVNQADTGNKKAYFHCHDIDGSNSTLVLIPCKCAKFVCTFSQTTQVPVLGASEPTAEVHLKTINPDDVDSGKDASTSWVFERLTKQSTNPYSSETRDWRLCVYWDPQDKSKNLYLAASRNGALSLCRDEECFCTDDGLRNPQTFFYLYKKGNLRCN